ncbi:hypothetical protein SPIRO4BDMA_50191 [uncultured spirochete]|uniref:Uncharacterized protein n=1 Tax=uncultured spirochete TaxID=156406 RepID=A0A3P3XQU0_9SPIR|nr:hypothetical protein SPIRO4BDMA_50191 [uncultured spirochete]
MLAVLEGRQEEAGGLDKSAIYRRLLRAGPNSLAI